MTHTPAAQPSPGLAELLAPYTTRSAHQPRSDDPDTTPGPQPDGAESFGRRHRLAGTPEWALAASLIDLVDLPLTNAQFGEATRSALTAYRASLQPGAGEAPAIAKSRRYVPDPDLPPAWIVDVDGTLARRRQGPGERGPFDWARVGEDLPDEPVMDLVDALARQADIVVMSGRDAVCLPETAEWLHKHGVHFDSLIMRPAGDGRRDAVVKAELFWRHVAPRWRVVGVVDDRNQVVRMWRDLGLLVAQVAEGDF